jgi:hypothetical protein
MSSGAVAGPAAGGGNVVTSAGGVDTGASSASTGDEAASTRTSIPETCLIRIIPP